MLYMDQTTERARKPGGRRRRKQPIDPRPGLRLQELRAAAAAQAPSGRLSLETLSARVRLKHCSASTIHKLETAQIDFTMDWAQALGDALEVHPLEFFDGQPKLAPGTQALAQLYEGLSEDDRRAVFRHADAIAEQTKVKKG